MSYLYRSYLWLQSGQPLEFSVQCASLQLELVDSKTQLAGGSEQFRIVPPNDVRSLGDDVSPTVSSYQTLLKRLWNICVFSIKYEPLYFS